MKLTSLIHTFLKNATYKVKFSFYLEGDDYTIILDYSSESEYEELRNICSVKTYDTYRTANIIEFWSPKKFTNMYIDVKKEHFYTITVLRNETPIRFYGRSRLFFDK